LTGPHPERRDLPGADRFPDKAIFSAQINASELRRASWQWYFFRYFDRVTGLAGGWRFSSFPGREGVPGRLLDSLALPVAAPGQQVGEDVEDRVVARLVLAGGPDGRGVVAGDADGHGEGDPVRIDVRLPGGLRFQRAQCLVDGQEGEEFLADEVRSLGPEDELRSAQPGLQLTVAVFDGLITNGKFCCVRRLRLSLTWWRRPLRLRASVLQTDVALSGEPDDPDPDVDHLPPAQPAS
jgi:hypothetical protein